MSLDEASVELNEVKAALRWHSNDTPRYLSEPDPKSSFIRFTLHLDTTSALFAVQIPISYKQHTKISTIYIHIHPRSILSLTHSIQQELPDAVKPIFDSASPSAICLDLKLSDPVAILIPTFISEPVTAARLRSGIILDSVHDLVQTTTTSLRIYMPNDALSPHQLQVVCDANTLRLFSNSDYGDHSRWFSDRGAKITTLLKPSPPSYNASTDAQENTPLYNESAIFAPPATSHKRKRSQDLVDKPDRVPSAAVIWDRLLELEAVVQHRPQSIISKDQSQHVQKLHDAIADLQTQLTQCENKVTDRDAVIAKLQTQLAQCEKKVEVLDTEIASLREAQDEANNEESVAMIDIHDSLRDFEQKLDFITRGKDDDEFKHTLKEDLFEELIARLSRG
ncbi:hypothetical protein FPOAC2_14512 [Fusarium poae]|jgi:hypothetical protein|uniref:uncharacterized protein n=1 Tax=Fusarium poae TaxID=36050 RepID=UPI001D04541E|nr:uncharacterized protein FPOAC1_013235 [Fusarium poae]KAG8665256.1 hypothetical protein FPOAC1_013235 [Fusarium poae]